jgi:hypothetical protein
MKVILIILLILLAIPTLIFMCTVGRCSYHMAEHDRVSNEYMSQLSIPKWDWHRDGDYVYIKGSVKNNGNRTVRYFEVHIEFTDKSGSVIDTTYTNSGEDLAPGWSKNWNTMHRWDSRMHTATASVGKVSVK